MLQVRLVSPAPTHEEVDVDAFLDSGANYSLFDGELAAAIGLDLMAGRYRAYYSTTGAEVDARCHNVVLSRPGFPPFSLEIGFSTSKIARNLLGRDFFSLVQIGFREQRLEFYIEPAP
jgi:hypothetical protein